MAIFEETVIEVAISRAHLARNAAILQSNAVCGAATVSVAQTSGQVDVPHNKEGCRRHPKHLSNVCIADLLCAVYPTLWSFIRYYH